MRLRYTLEYPLSDLVFFPRRCKQYPVGVLEAFLTGVRGLSSAYPIGHVADERESLLFRFIGNCEILLAGQIRVHLNEVRTLLFVLVDRPTGFGTILDAQHHPAHIRRRTVDNLPSGPDSGRDGDAGWQLPSPFTLNVR